MFSFKWFSINLPEMAASAALWRRSPSRPGRRGAPRAPGRTSFWSKNWFFRKIGKVCMYVVHVISRNGLFQQHFRRRYVVHVDDHGSWQEHLRGLRTMGLKAWHPFPVSLRALHTYSILLSKCVLKTFWRPFQMLLKSFSRHPHFPRDIRQSRGRTNKQEYITCVLGRTNMNT